MLKFFLEIFKISYISIKSYNTSLTNISVWDKKVREINLQINELIFKYISSGKYSNSQILYNSINNVINFHVRRRNLKKFKTYSLFKFIFWAYYNYLIGLFYDLKNYLKNSLLVYEDFNISKKTIVAFGFPSHSFNYENSSNYSSSFIEFLTENNLIDKSYEVISIEEYVRKSLNKKIDADKEINSFARTKINSSLSIKNLIFLPITFLKDLIYYLRNYRILNFSTFLYYLNKKSKLSALKNFLYRTGNFGFISKIFLLDNFEIDHFLIDKNLKNLISTFCYSQNNLDVNSNFINYMMSLNKIQRDDKRLIFNELNHNVFSYYKLSPINFFQSSNFFQNLRSIANSTYKINLNEDKIYGFVNNSKYSNLGFEKVNVINLKEKEFNILINDNTSESPEKNFKIFVMGVFSGLEHFISNFNDEILSMSLKQKITFFYKGKYGDNRKSLQNILRSKKKYNCKLEILEPYAKFKLQDNKCFDLSINLPFTSTIYTFSEISKSSIFYLPERFYFNYKNLPTNLIIGKKNLISLITKLNKKNK